MNNGPGREVFMQAGMQTVSIQIAAGNTHLIKAFSKLTPELTGLRYQRMQRFCRRHHMQFNTPAKPGKVAIQAHPD
jgi:hypothetical protein